jgi:hypothetical protein
MLQCSNNERRSDMNTTLHHSTGQTFSLNFSALKDALRDPLGIASGLRAHRVYTHLSALSDTQLAAQGITRSDISQIAVAAMNIR